MARDFRDDGTPLVRLAGLTGDSLLAGCNYLDPEMVERRWPHFRLRAGDTLISTSASLGRVARVDARAADAIAYTGIIRMRPRDGRLLPEFIQYLVAGEHFQRQVEAMGAGSVMRHFGPTHLRSMTVVIPSVGEQRTIAQILAALDDKIESDRRLAGLLENTAATLFHARFVDFVGVEEFDDSEIGRIPRGWRTARIGDLVPVVGGSTPSTTESRFWNGTHCWATPKDLSGARSPILLDTDRHITDDGVSRISSKLLPVRTVLLSSRAPVGYTAISFVELAINQGFIAIPPSDGVPSEFVFFWLREHMEEIKAHAGGTTFAEISKRQFRPLPMVVPPAERLEEFASVAAPMFDLMAMHEAEVRTLTDLRDALLPKLISGQIRVQDTDDPAEVIEPAVEAFQAAAS